MSGRIVNVRPKPGFVFDGQAVIPAPSNVVPFMRDKLTNALSGMGSGRDVRSANAYTSRPLTQYELAAAYSGSGLMRKIVQIPALDMVREWRDWTGLDDEQAKAVFDEEKRLSLRQKSRQAEVLRGMGGGALVLGLPGNPSEPAPPTIGKGKLAFIHVVSRWHLTFDTMQDDATADGFGEPAMWKLTTAGGQQSIHPSRVVPFRADTTAALAMPGQWGGHDAFWGECTVQQVLEAVQDNDTARAAFAALINKARLLRLGIPNLTDIVSSPGGETAIQNRLAAVVLAESIHNATIYDAGDAEGKGGETITEATYSFTGVKDILNSYAEFVAAIADIPATRLLGRSPEGMHLGGDSGQSQQLDWNKMVKARQTLDLSPCIDRVDPYLVQSATGKVVDTAASDWAPLDTPSQKERAETFWNFMQGAEKLQATATIPDEAFARGMQSYMIEEGLFPELEAALAEIPEDERYGVQPDPNADPSELDPTQQGGGDPASTGGGETVPAKPANGTPPAKDA
jgi:phage-related protein (TIGR01555 family)